jgi:hypothetical protein
MTKIKATWMLALAVGVMTMAAPNTARADDESDARTAVSIATSAQGGAYTVYLNMVDALNVEETLLADALMTLVEIGPGGPPPALISEADWNAAYAHFNTAASELSAAWTIMGEQYDRYIDGTNETQWVGGDEYLSMANFALGQGNWSAAMTFAVSAAEKYAAAVTTITDDANATGVERRRSQAGIERGNGEGYLP